MKTTQVPGRSAGPTPVSARRFYGRAQPLSSGQPESAEPVQPSIERAERFGHSLDRLRQPAPAPAETANAPVQRVVTVKKAGLSNLKTITARTKGLASALANVKEGERDAVIDTLNNLAKEDKEHKFSDWDNAVNRAKSVAKSQSSRTKVVRNRDLKEKEKVVESEESSSSDSVSESSDSESDFSEFSSDNDEGLGGLSFAGGQLAGQDGALSKSVRKGVVSGLGLAHTDKGHGPSLSEKQLKDAALLQKGSGKFASDEAMVRTLKRAKRAVRKGEIDPQTKGNQFVRIPRKAAVAFRRFGKGEDREARQVQTRKARVFFKKGAIKSIHPFAEDAAEDADIDE